MAAKRVRMTAKIGTGEVQSGKRSRPGPVQVTVHSWGQSAGIMGFEGVDAGTLLFQLQIVHEGYNHMGSSFLKTARNAIPSFQGMGADSDEKSLEAIHHIRIKTGATPQSTGGAPTVDPDKIGTQAWRPVVYVAGADPTIGLLFIAHMVQWKISTGELAGGIALEVVQRQEAWNFSPNLPAPWVFKCSKGAPHPFEAVPPKDGRHLLMEMDKIDDSDAKAPAQFNHTVTFYGGTFRFRDAFDAMGWTLEKVKLSSGVEEYIRHTRVESEEGLASLRTFMRDALHSTPVCLLADEDEESSVIVESLLAPSSTLYLPK